MPYLNFKEARVARHIEPLPGQTSGEERDFAMSLRLEEDGAAKLLAALVDLSSQVVGPGMSAPELRVDLPGDWALFWKIRAGESRMLVAHPEAEQWVATLALSPSHWAALIRSLGALSKSTGPVVVHALESLSSVSNLELEIGRA